MKLTRFFLVVLSFKLVCSQFDFNSMVEVAVDVLGTAVEIVGRTTGLTDACPFVEDPVESLHNL